jgi:tetrapyrrole methylase family protein/MazG family protein
MITLLGLGPGDEGLLTREAWQVLNAATQVLLRTRKHPTVAGLPAHLQLHDFDALYDRAEHFADVYQHIAESVIAQAQQGDVIYAVPGHPLVGEATVPMIMQKARELGIAVKMVSGLSFIEPTLERLACSPAMHNAPNDPIYLDPVNGLQLCDAQDLAQSHHPRLNPDVPVIVAQIYAREVASNVKLTLMNQYPPDHRVTMINATGKPNKTKSGVQDKSAIHLTHANDLGDLTVTLATLDHDEYFNPLTSLYVPALPQHSAFETLQETAAHLRAPDGCPWDREQTHQSLRSNLLEETYEVLDAIDHDDMDALKEELGDLLFNVIMQAQMATEAEYFRMGDVIAEITAKLRRRHPHVFGESQPRQISEINATWEKIKHQEIAAKGKPARVSALDGILLHLPALARAQKMAHRAIRAGFDWHTPEQRAHKVREELDEVLTANDDSVHRVEEMGDLLFTVCVLADGYKIDAESALRMACIKFDQRYRAVERIVKTRDLNMKTMHIDDLVALWREAKASLAVPSGE